MRWAIKHKSGRTLFVTSDEFIANNRRKMGWIVEEVKMASREQFESWLEDVHGLYGEDVEWQTERNCYANFGIHLAWCAWKASRAAIEIELPEADIGYEMMEYYEPQQVIEAIEQAGLKVKK